MDTTDLIVTKALEYYDKNNERYADMFKDVEYLQFKVSDKDMKHNKVVMLDKNKKEIMRHSYEHIGMFDNDTKAWTWAWSVPIYSKNATYTSRKILNYGLDLELRHLFLRSELITSRFRVSNPIQLDLHVALASYLAKIPIVFPVRPKLGSFDVQKDNMVRIVPPHKKSSEDSLTYYIFIEELE